MQYFSFHVLMKLMTKPGIPDEKERKQKYFHFKSHHRETLVNWQLCHG